jgi:hypothetical protein
MKFKIGDKVRVVKTISSWEKKKEHLGKVYTIAGIYENHDYPYSFRECTNFDWCDEELELVPFTKADLKDGMVVECSDGKRKMLINGAFRGTHCYTAVSAYTDTLECRYNESTINKVYTSKALSLSSYFDDKNLTLIWERPKEEPAKKMTVAEIEKELGYKVEIISEN